VWTYISCKTCNCSRCYFTSVEPRKIIEQEQVSYPDKERFFTNLGLLLSDRISIGKASELLGLRVDDLLLLMHKLGIKYSILNEEEIEEELNAYRRVFKVVLNTSPIIILTKLGVLEELKGKKMKYTRRLQGISMRVKSV